ncbi:recombinase family protein, partial [Candidatus Kaiserbacteria bacterium]|nr:recombinase family protein [Candidatus Kaiserbacteria bacterium]
MAKKKQINKVMALIYCRVSSDRQMQEGHGLDSQEQRCKKYALEHNYGVEKVFRDSYTGGGDFMKRPAMADMISYIEKKPYTNYVVIFDDTKRLARDHMEYWRLRNLFKSLEAEVESPNFSFGDTEESWLQEAITAIFSDFERRSNKRQVNQKMRARLESGYWTFNSTEVPGYKRKDLPDKTWILVRSEPKASIIKEALEGYANGRFDTKTDVQKFLQRKNYLAENKQKRVYLSRVDRLLERSWLYAGFIEHLEWEVERRIGKHEAIITLEVLKRIEDKLQNKSRVRIRKDYNEDFPLRPHVLCAGCGKKLTASWTRGRSGTYHPYYRCSNDSKVCPYGNKSIRREAMETEFRELLTSLRPNQGVVSLTRAILDDLYKKKHSETEGYQADIDKQLRKLDTEIEKLMDRAMNTKNEIMAERYDEQASKLIEEKEKLLENNSKSDNFDVD